MSRRIIIATVIASVCLAASGTTGLAQANDEAATKARLEQIANSYTPNHAFMGTVLVVEGDHVLLDKGYAMASLEWQVPNTPETKFRLGSLTKQFTATLILLLQQDGKLSISDPISKYLPDSPPAWAKITLANLLGHTSGIPSFTGFKEFHTWSMSAHTPDEEIALFRDKPLDFEPGSKFDYSNSNFIVLGVVVEKVSGKKYVDLLRERIFDPLGMKDTGLDSDELVLPKRAVGYMPGPHGVEVARSESMSIPWSAGAIYSTTGDLLKWEHGLFGGKVLSADSLKLMTTPGKGDYGLGVFIANRDGVRVVSHGGGIEGFNTNLMYAPEKQIAVVVLSNVNGGAPDSMGNQLMDTVLGKPVVLATERKAVPITKEELAKFAGVYDLAPTFSLTIAVSGDHLTGQGTGQPSTNLMYQGVKDGHPTFFVAQVGADIEFVPDASGAITSLILHQGGQNIPAKKH
ncbi:serine hydrolase [Telmatobacter sp. DSM 110680]|uniref:Serine hydrolase n=1 Tax=Telmatobacter sp. DSM 110680 TaxID=3036704 RepID=A0AAU7DDP8_9BACT